MQITVDSDIDNPIQTFATLAGDSNAVKVGELDPMSIAVKEVILPPYLLRLLPLRMQPEHIIA
jgi:hypothetical protein